MAVKGLTQMFDDKFLQRLFAQSHFLVGSNQRINIIFEQDILALH
jgi:hypothetical protein